MRDKCICSYEAPKVALRLARQEPLDRAQPPQAWVVIA
jgi:hypothetical protein